MKTKNLLKEMDLFVSKLRKVLEWADERGLLKDVCIIRYRTNGQMLGVENKTFYDN